MCNLIIFMSSESCHVTPVLEHSYHSKKKSLAPTPYSYLWPEATTSVLSLYVHLLFLNILYKLIHIVSGLLWLIYFNYILCGSLHVEAFIILCSFYYWTVFCLWLHHCVYTLANWWTFGFFHIPFASMNATMNIHKQVFVLT